MFNVVSLIIGIIALLCAVVAFVPLLGWLNWFIIPLAVIGAGVGLVSKSRTGMSLNIFVIIVALVRLSIGGGLI
ncbi:MAG TPA: hypothetical protein VM760_03610 [Sphingomicrobium sp.]|jgi:hypothetical protein|nr:hypothetical protein [Sphingomicrobium sp.]